MRPAWLIRYGEQDVFVKCNSRDRVSLFRLGKPINSPCCAVRRPSGSTEVYGVGSDRDYSFLLLEYIKPQPLDAHSALRLGQQLAHLHQWSEQPQFGLDFDNNLTTTPQPNSWLRRWSVFFAEQRIGWRLQVAAEKAFSTAMPS
ncbi:fructosamine kinase family protein [Pantoea ananatis]